MISGRLGRRVDSQGDLARLGLGRVGGRPGGPAACGATAVALHRQLAGVGQREGAQIVDQALELLGFVVHRLEAGRGRLEHAVAQRLDVAGDDGQRRAQVVGDVGGHLAAQLVGAGQVGAHLVEGLRQRAQLVGRTHRDLLLQLTSGHGLDGAGQVAHGLGEGAGQDDAQEQGDHRRAERGQRQGPVGARQVLRFAVVQRGRPACVDHRADLVAVYFDRFLPGQSRRCARRCDQAPPRRQQRPTGRPARTRPVGAARPARGAVRLAEVVARAVPRAVRLVVAAASATNSPRARSMMKRSNSRPVAARAITAARPMPMTLTSRKARMSLNVSERMGSIHMVICQTLTSNRLSDAPIPRGSDPCPALTRPESGSRPRRRSRRSAGCRGRVRSWCAGCGCADRWCGRRLRRWCPAIARAAPARERPRPGEAISTASRSNSEGVSRTGRSADLDSAAAFIQDDVGGPQHLVCGRVLAGAAQHRGCGPPARACRRAW